MLPNVKNFFFSKLAFYFALYLLLNFRSIFPDSIYVYTLENVTTKYSLTLLIDVASCSGLQSVVSARISYFLLNFPFALFFILLRVIQIFLVFIFSAIKNFDARRRFFLYQVKKMFAIHKGKFTGKLMYQNVLLHLVHLAISAEKHLN